MGNCKNKSKDITKVYQLEQRLFEYSGLVLDKSFKIFDVSFDFNNEKHYIHTIHCGEENDEVLVLIHGYGCTSVIFYQMLESLSKHYKIYCIDLLGMGLSSRPKFNCESTEDTINYFVDSIEKWRLALGLKEFTLLGHSFGGYMSTQYANKYADIVKKLILVSPCGVTSASTEYDYSEESESFKSLGFFRRQIVRFRNKFFREKLILNDLIREHSFLVCLFGKWISRRRFKKCKKESADTLHEFFLETWRFPHGSEKALHYILNPNIIAYQPLEDIIFEMKIPILMFYGTADWMCDKGAKRLQKKKTENFKLYYIDDSGHQIPTDNSKDLIKHIINDSYEIIVYNNFLAEI